MGNQCGGCAGTPEEGEISMKVETQVRKTNVAKENAASTHVFDASQAEYDEI